MFLEEFSIFSDLMMLFVFIDLFIGEVRSGVWGFFFIVWIKEISLVYSDIK